MLAAGNAADVYELTLAETQALDVGSSFSADFIGEPVPTLAEILALAKGKIKVNIELKYYGQDVKLAERVVDVVREAGMVDEVVIMSLYFIGVEDVQRFAPEITTGFLVSDLTFGDETALDVDFLAVSANLATTRFVRDTHAADKELYVWTLNDAESVDTFLNRGVDSIITDYPVMVREQILVREALTSTEKLLLAISDLLSQ